MSPSVHKRSPIRRHSSDYSGSPVRGRSSPRRRNSPGKERSPPRHRSSPRRDKSPVWRRSSPRKERSPARHRSSPRPRSPIRSGSSHRTKSPAREKLHGRVQSPKHDRSISPVFQSPSLRTKRSERAQVERVTTKATERARSTSPVSRSPSPRTRRLKRAQIEWETNKLKERERSISPVSQSLSPRSKRLRRTQAEREAGKVMEREREGHNSRNGDKGRRRERDEDRELPSERRPARDKNDDGSSRSRNMRHGRSISPTERGHRSRYSSRSPLRASRTGARDEETHARGAEQQDDEYNDSLSKMKAMEESLEEKQKQKPSFELSGKLAAETNRVRGITLLFTEPPDARKPDIRWRLYVFKAGEVLNGITCF